MMFRMITIIYVLLLQKQHINNMLTNNHNKNKDKVNDETNINDELMKRELFIY